MDLKQFDFEDSDEFMNFEVKDSPKKTLEMPDKVVHKKQESYSRKRKVGDNDADEKNIIDDEDEQVCKEFRNKISNNINKQLNSRKIINETLQNKLMEVIRNLEKKYNMLEKDGEKLEGIINTTVKCLEETQIVFRQKIKQLVELKQSFINERNNAQDECNLTQLEKKLDEVMEKVKEEMISITKKKDFAMMATLLQNIQKM